MTERAHSGTLSPFHAWHAWADRARKAGERVLALCAAVLGRGWVLDTLAVAGLAALALYSLFNGFDLSRLVNADALQPVHVQYFPILEFRPPPSNNLFPDVLLHVLIGQFLPDPLWQKLVVGWLLFAASVLLIGVHKGQLAALLVCGVLALSGFGFTDSASHYSLPLMLLLYQLAKPRALKAAVLFLVVFSDPLILLPLTILLLAPENSERRLENLGICLLALLAGEVFYSEFSLALVHIAVATPVFGVIVLIAQRLGLASLLCAAIALVLPAAVFLEVASERYALPVAACFILLLFETGRRALDWRYVAAPAAAAGIFAGTADQDRLELFSRQYDCLLETLVERNVTVLAADHWTAKPLYFAARAKNQPLTLTQTDFADGDISLWMAPYAFAGEPTRYAVRSDTICAYVENPAAYCNQDSVAEIQSREKICDGLELFTYTEEVPGNFAGRPRGKLESLRRHLSAYVEKAGAGLL